MAERTAIAWTDATFNPWIGCTKVGPGCDHCYAEALDRRYRWGGAVHWGVGVPRYRTSASMWRKPLAWQTHAGKGLLPDGKTPTSGRRPRVFCASLADWLDMEAPDKWRHDLIDLIGKTPALDWLLLTKRIVRVKFWEHALLPNVWLGATIIDQFEADRDVPKLLAATAKKHFVSYEPALGPVNWAKFPGLDWIIVGGESAQGGAKPRPFDVNWAVETVRYCKAAGVPVFVKQLGSNPFSGKPHTSVGNELIAILETRPNWRLQNRAGADPAQWPEALRVQEFPS